MDYKKDEEVSKILSETDEAKRASQYNAYVKNVTPTHNWLLNMAKAFLVGGIICTLGQFITNVFMKNFHMDKETAGLYNIIVLILLSAVLTGLQLYQKLAKFGGAGTVVPITGFANSVAAAAEEFTAEGQVFGIGCKIFTIAGPVILYGILSSWVLGILYYFIR